MNRRELLQCAAILVGGNAVGRLGFALSDEQLAYLAAAPDYISQKIEFFTPSQRALVTAMAETIIPRTDTPGARDAGVPRFIELMVANWLNEQERQRFTTGLEVMETSIPAEFGASFDRLDAARQLAILEAMEEAATESSWYTPGNIRRAFIDDAPFICMVKELTVWGFFTSEAGASQVLRSDMMPMRFDGDAPLAPGDSAWASYMFLT